MKSIIKKYLPSFLVSYLIKYIKNKPVENFFKKKYKNKVLISYVVEPFNKSSLSHTVFFEAMTAAEIFDELGYQVDVIQYDMIKKNLEKYDVIFGFGETIEYFYSHKYSNNTKVIIYSTGMHQFFQNVKTLQRVKELQKEKSAWLINSARLTDFSWFRQIVLSDAVITLGNMEVKKTFEPFYMGELYPLNAPFYKIRDYQEVGEKSPNAHLSYVWFGSSGLVHKGLDLCLDFFKQNPDLILHVCGPIENEPDFVSRYHDELFNTKNIYNHGFVDINSEKFNEILRSSYFAIFPSCSEGGSPSLLTVIGNGAMIPVMTKAASIDVPNACYIEKLTIAGIECAVNESQNIIQEKLFKKAQENAEFVINNNSLENYRKNLKEILEQSLI
ncbi:glycosyltransferase [Marinomonas sp. BSi20584]|uniref:glycosyltransferase n=1 Tax=Marinomonas sp. BSi20584 TaxID=1594462 RepID=UPI000C1E9653|nr:glycosyltransferase [Marinomonas sp. BSi20584]PJE53280.1 hypothetical protein TY87_21680 [Marinomonas sp. BSi20584]